MALFLIISACAFALTAAIFLGMFVYVVAKTDEKCDEKLDNDN